MSVNSKKLLLPIVILSTGMAFFIANHHIAQFRKPTLEKWSEIAVGASEQRVRRLLGTPYAQYGKEYSIRDYYVEGYGKRARPISGKVLIYLSADMILYVWIDDSGKVEDVFVGVS